MNNEEKINILYKGKQLPVDISSLTEEEREDIYGMQSVPMVRETFKLNNRYSISYNKHEWLNGSAEYTFVKEDILDHYPTDNELIERMNELGLNRFDYVQIDSIKELDWEDSYWNDDKDEEKTEGASDL